MTDEEKAEKYAKEISRCRECINYNYCHKIENEYHPKCKKWEWLFVGLKKGLAEGRKEKEELIGMYINVDLEKENANLKAQIEKMKCCSNCKHRTLYINGGTVMCYSDVVHEFGKPRQKCDNWEIAE